MSLFKGSLCNLQILRASLATYDFILLYADSVNNAIFHVFLDPIKAFKASSITSYRERLKRNSQNELDNRQLYFLVFLVPLRILSKKHLCKSYNFSKPRQLSTKLVNTEKNYFDSLSNSWMKFNFLFDRVVYTVFTL